MNSKQKYALKQLARRGLGLLLGSSSAEYPREILRAPSRILLVNGAHIGDVVISTSLIPVIRSAFPHAEIGFVVGTWSRMVVAGHPDVTHVHVVDHWFMNREPKPLVQKIGQYRATRAQSLSEIHSVQYDVAICLHAFYSDLMRLMADARIPVRVGFEQSLFSSQAHITRNYPENPFLHQGECLAELLRAIGISTGDLQKRKATLKPDTEQSVREVCKLLNVSRLDQRPYIVIHMGSGAPARELSPAVWHEVASRLSRQHTLLFTGKGPRDEDKIQQLLQGLHNCINAANKLSWDGFVTAVRHASVLYGVESMAGHVAAAVDTRSVVVYAGTAGPARWRPESSRSTVWTIHVPCAPCGMIGGCKDMKCIRGITADDILNPLDRLR